MIRMNGSDGGHESRGLGSIYTLAAHPRPVHTSFTPPRILSPQRLHESSAISDEPPWEFFTAGDFSAGAVHLRTLHIL
jgi:hypothetical protein